MEQDVENSFRSVCCACLSNDRDLFSINNITQIYQIFRLIMYDFAGDRFGDSQPEIAQVVCWECMALMKRFVKFKWQVHSAQEHLRVLALSQTQETLEHSYMSQSLSCLEIQTKADYDRIYFEFPTLPEERQYIAISSTYDIKNEQLDVAQVVKDNINLEIEDHLLNVPQIVLENSITGGLAQLVVDGDSFSNVKGELPELTVGPLTGDNLESVIMPRPKNAKIERQDSKHGYITQYMSEEEMLASREEAKKKVHYASSVYKCELCIIGFYTQQQVEDHFVNAHRAKEGLVPCRVCYVYVPEVDLPTHEQVHYTRHECRTCGHIENSSALAAMHARTHTTSPQHKVKKKKKHTEDNSPTVKPGDLRKLLSKTTIVGYQCLECEMFFKTTRARKNHVARFHREGLQCDVCKKRFVNKTTLATHLRLHEGPLPREMCPICHKMVRSVQLKYHVRRHESTSRFECTDCCKVFSHLATYQAHLKYSRAHATEHVLKFPCPMCNKGYPTKDAMQDHFNYQHLGKTAHKCPVCEKPIATKANVERHMMRVHSEKKEKPRNHVCQMCGKAFTDKKALTQHAVIHSGARPLSCDVCHQTFKQKASLYTHRKRVHKLVPSKRMVTYLHDQKADT